MRLLNAVDFKLHDFLHDQIPPYAILSHTWGAAEDEVIFQDMADLEKARKKPGFEKIRGCCKQALQDRFEWVWIDSCCIDKASSSELSEAINTMFRWYQNSHICYAYLNDVIASPAVIWHTRGNCFKHSRWFSRGWTLQELIAPHVVHFFNRSWENIATRASFASILGKITGVPEHILRGGSICGYCALEKMSWARNRKTTRTEDVAYSLLGLFEINMPLLYGEGDKAFIRLQEEILKSSGDYSLFAWEDDRPFVTNIFASSPDLFRMTFCGSNSVRVAPVESLSLPPPSIWGRTMKLEMHLGSDEKDGFVAAYLNCRLEDQVLCIRVQSPNSDDQHTWRRGGRCTLMPLASLSDFSPKQVCFKMMADPSQERHYDGRYTRFVVPQLPSCMTLLPANRRNTQPITRLIHGEVAFVFVHDTADRNDCISIRILHGSHGESPPSFVLPDSDSIPEDVLLAINSNWPDDLVYRREREYNNIYEDMAHCEQIELTLSTFGLDSRAPWCNLIDTCNHGHFLQQVPIYDRYSMLVVDKYALWGHFLTIAINPSPDGIFKVQISCRPVDIVDEVLSSRARVKVSLRKDLSG